MNNFKIVLKTLLTIIIAVGAFSFTEKNEPQNHRESNKIYWSENYKLTWKDFKGKINDFDQRASAITYSIVDFQAEITNDFVVLTARAVFIKDESWAEKNNTDNLLKHEQVHFDMTELRVREIKKAFAETTFTSYDDFNKRLDDIYDNISDKYDAYDGLYDKETVHSTNIEEQLRWNKKVEKELYELRKYTSPTVVIKFKK